MNGTVSQGLFLIYIPARNLLLRKPCYSLRKAYRVVFWLSFWMLLLLFPWSSWRQSTNPHQHVALTFRFATQLTQIPGRRREKCPPTEL